MKPILLALVLLSLPAAASAGQTGADTADDTETPMVVVTTRALRARSVIGPGDVTLAPRAVPGALDSLDDVVGMEASGWLQAGAALMPEQIAPAAVIERNQLVTLVFRKGMLEITTEGRALERAAPGESVRTMNLESKAIVTGRALPGGLVEVR